MKNRKDRILVEKTLTELRAAAVNLGAIRPSAMLEPEEFLELCELRQQIDPLIERLLKLKRGGRS